MQRSWLFLLLAAALAALPFGVAADEPDKKTEKILKLFVDEFVPLTPGIGKFPAAFTMGTADGPESEKPPAAITFRRPFALAKYEVTQELYEAVAGKNPSKWKGPRNSVEMVSLDEANEFCRKATAELRKRKRIDEKEVIRLPSEAEWEYACRAGTTTKWSYGDDVKEFGDFGWFDGNAKGNDPPVGKKKPNAWGLYDMHGYVWEWCQDSWQPTLASVAKDGGAFIDLKETDHVLRGGSWADGADKARSAFRHHKAADFRSDSIGFRCVKSGPIQEKK
jgi:formylglycine-generating enzyme required for sulfatase activity